MLMLPELLGPTNSWIRSSPAGRVTSAVTVDQVSQLPVTGSESCWVEAPAARLIVRVTVWYGALWPPVRLAYPTVTGYVPAVGTATTAVMLAPA